MDVDEVLRFKAPLDLNTAPSLKRKHETVEGSDDEEEDSMGPLPPRAKTREDEILEMLEEEPAEGEEFDLSALKRQVQNLEKKIYKNQEMRVKYPDEPAKFLDSEAELHEEIQRMMVLATAPDLYPDFVSLNALPSILNLLIHENTDIAIAVVALINELLDSDAVEEAGSADDAKTLVEAMIDAHLLPLLYQNLERLDEEQKEDADAVHQTMGILESMCEIDPALADKITTEAPFLQWLMGRLANKKMDANRLYASEIIAILLQSSDENKRLLGTQDGVDKMLRMLAYYRARDPKTPEELELLNNLFDCMCSCLLRSENKTKFLQGEGIELMIIMLREKKLGMFGAIRVLTFAMGGFEPAQCRRFVEKLGLKSLFPRFMKTPKRGSKGSSESEFEEHVCSVLASLLRNVKDGKLRPRILQKFVEDDYAKIERLLELHEKYSERVAAADKEIEDEKLEYLDEGEEPDEELKDMFYLKRLDRGLFTLQLVDYIIAELCASDVDQIRHRIMSLLAQQGKTPDEIVAVLREYAENVGDASRPAEQENERRHILDLAAALEA